MNADVANQPSRATRFAALLERRRGLLLALWTAHTFVLHWLFIGFCSWDGVGYRVPPAVEVVQHGSYGFERYDQWAFIGYVPFVELVQVPFLFVFKLPGLFIGFPLLVFPLCVVAVFAFVRELTGDSRAATFGALAYAAIPMINQQPYSGYVDFAVCALLAFVIYALLRVGAVVGREKRAESRERPAPGSRLRERPSFVLVQLAVATALFTMSRTQAVYVLILILPVVAYTLFFERTAFRVRLTKPRALALATAAFAVGVVPTAAVQVTKYLRHGTPTYPFQFQLLGIKLGEGVSMRDLFFYGGLRAETPIEFLRSFVSGWIWPRDWPIGAFYDSRNIGGGFVLIVAVLVAPFFFANARARARTRELLVVGACVGISLMARDFWLPRYAYTLVIAFCVMIGRGISCALTPQTSRALQRTAKPLFWFGTLVLLAHLARPEFDLYMIEKAEIGPRLNPSASDYFRYNPLDIAIFPDRHAKLVIIGTSLNRFVLHLYGRRLTNEVVRTVPANGIGERCANLAPILAADKDALFIDDDNVTRDCDRECAIENDKDDHRYYQFAIACRAWRIRPAARPTEAL